MQLKYLIFSALLLALGSTVFAQEPGNAAPANPAAAEPQEETAEIDEGSTIEKGSFLIGYNFLTRLSRQGADIDFDKLVEGMKAASAESESGMSPEEQKSVMSSYQKLMMARKQAKKDAETEKNRIEGKQAFAEFAKQEGAKEVEDGVMYVVLKEGDGEIPEAPDRVKLNYVGTYVNGEQFDSSLDKGEPITNGVLRFVPGFSKALQQMKVGSKWKVIIRGDKAYGMKARPPMEVNKTLVFEIDLLEILDP